MNVSLLNGNTFTMKRDTVNIIKHTYQEVLRRLLKSQNSGRLKTVINVVEQVPTDFFDKSLKRKFPDQKFRRLLVLPDLSEGDGPRTVTVRLLDFTHCFSWMLSSH